MQDLSIDPTPRSILAALVTGGLSPDSVDEEAWEELIPLAVSQGLGPLLLWTLRAAGWASDAGPRWEPLEVAARQGTLHFLLLENARRRVSAALEQAGVPAIWLKGIALAHTVYPAPRLRPMQDLDVLVPIQRLEAARRAAAELGFRAAEIDFAALAGSTEMVRHHDHLVGGRGQVSVDLHFRLLVPDLCRALPEERLDWFWGQTQPVDGAGPAFTILKPEAQLLHLCAHLFLQHDEKFLSLLRLLDLHLLATKTQVDWDLVIEQARALGWSQAAGRALRLAVESYATPLPDGVLPRLGEQRQEGERITASSGSRDEFGRWEEWKFTFHRLSLLKRLRLVWITLFPPGPYVRQMYRVPAAKRLLPYYLYRWYDGGSEVARALGLSRPGRDRLAPEQAPAPGSPKEDRAGEV